MWGEAQEAMTGGANCCHFMPSTLPKQAKVLVVAIWFLRLLRISFSFAGHIAHLSVKGIFLLDHKHFPPLSDLHVSCPYLWSSYL